MVTKKFVKYVPAENGKLCVLIMQYKATILLIRV